MATVVEDSNNKGDDDNLPPRLPTIDPPLLNSANPWATTREQLRDLYRCAATGAVTTRTALLRGFPHDDNVHQFRFFDGRTHRVVVECDGDDDGNASLNTLGYSPISLEEYLGFIEQIIEDEEVVGERVSKPFIISVTGDPEAVAGCYGLVANFSEDMTAKTTTTAAEEKGKTYEPRVPLALEINLSCPNIPGKPPPAYDGEALKGYVRRIAKMADDMAGLFNDPKYNNHGKEIRIPWGLKTPPYTHAGQFEMFIEAIRDWHSPSAITTPSPISFITATNTLGSCLLLTPNEEEEKEFTPAIPGSPSEGIGGLAGAPLHPLALGNVATLRRMLDADPRTRHVQVIGVGGVSDSAGYKRMRSVGAVAVGVGTALGVKGVGVFGEILNAGKET